MKHEPAISRRPAREPDASDFSRAQASYKAGEGVDQIVIGQWLLTWGGPQFKDFPEWLNDRNA